MQKTRQERRKSGAAAAEPGLRRLPSVAAVVDSRPLGALVREHGRPLVTGLVRDELERLRERVRRGLDGEDLARAVRPAALAAAVSAAARELLEPRPREVINATGVVVHTNLGRAALSERAAARIAATATGYVDLEYDRAAGARGSRQAHLEPLLARLFPGRAALCVNNNAAAILLALRALARRREVVVSRGELVEIGGSFRVPDVLSVSGAKLVEVGTTNRTRVTDYERAIGPRTGALLKVHTSNFKIVGFTAEASIDELSRLARSRDVPLVVDWGSGDLVDLEPLGIRDELPVAEILARGADLVTFSGDKLLGGPQAGLAVGRADLVERMRRDPLARAVRLDRILVAALHATLASYVRGAAADEVPTLRMLGLDAAAIERRARRVRREVLRRAPGARVDLLDGVSRTGGGSSPTGERPTRLLAVGEPTDAVRLEAALRAGEPPVIARIHGGRVLVDLRTVLPRQEEALAARVAAAFEVVRR